MPWSIPPLHSSNFSLSLFPIPTHPPPTQPETIGHLVSLKDLWLDGNQLAVIPAVSLRWHVYFYSPEMGLHHVDVSLPPAANATQVWSLKHKNTRFFCGRGGRFVRKTH